MEEVELGVGRESGLTGFEIDVGASAAGQVEMDAPVNVSSSWEQNCSSYIKNVVDDTQKTNNSIETWLPA